MLAVTADPIRVVSPDWAVVDIKPELATFYAQQMAEALRTEGFKVSTSADFATMLGVERQKQLLGCNTEGTSCMAELANALGCELTLSVNLAKLGDSFRGLARFVSSRDGSVLASVELEAANESKVVDRIRVAAKKLAREYRVAANPKVAAVATSESNAGEGESHFSPWWIPGALGVLSVGLGVALTVAADKTHANFAMTSDYTTAENLLGQGKREQAGAWVASGLGAAAIIGSAVWLIVLSRHPVTPTVSVTPQGAAFGLTGSF